MEIPLAWITVSPFSRDNISLVIYFISTPWFRIFWIINCTFLIGFPIVYKGKYTPHCGITTNNCWCAFLTYGRNRIIQICKGISNLKAGLDYCEDPAWVCESLNFCFPAQTEFSWLAEKPSHCNWTNSLVNADSFYANFTNTTFQKIPIPYLTLTMKQKFLH